MDMIQVQSWWVEIQIFAFLRQQTNLKIITLTFYLAVRLAPLNIMRAAPSSLTMLTTLLMMMEKSDLRKSMSSSKSRKTTNVLEIWKMSTLSMQAPFFTTVKWQVSPHLLQAHLTSRLEMMTHLPQVDFAMLAPKAFHSNQTITVRFSSPYLTRSIKLTSVPLKTSSSNTARNRLWNIETRCLCPFSLNKLIVLFINQVLLLL